MTALRRRADQLLAAMCVVWIAIHHGALLGFGYGRDQGIYAYVARVILDGGMPYRDAWDFKPPGIFLIYAATRAVLGDGMWAIRLVEALGLCAMAWGMTRFARGFFGDWRPGLVAAALAIGLHVQTDFWHTAQPESFGGMLLIAALVVAARPGRARLVGCGLLFGFTALLKPTLGGAALVVAGWRAWEAWDEEHSARALMPPALIFAGAAIPVLLCVAWFGAAGALGAAREIFGGFVPAYTKLGWRRQEVIPLGYRGIIEWLTLYSSIMPVGLALMLGLKRERDRRGAVLVGLVLAAEMIGVISQAKFFSYHWAATWPPTALLAGLGWWRLHERLRDRGVITWLAFVAFLLLALFTRTATLGDLHHSSTRRLGMRLEGLVGRLPQAQKDELDSVYDGDGITANLQAGVVREVARRIRTLAPTDRTLYVWGFEPTLYVLTGLRAPTRYFHNEPMRMPLTAPVARPELMRALAADKPAIIVLQKRDVIPKVVGDWKDSVAALRGFPELEKFISDGYRPLFELDYLTVVVDKNLARRAGGPK